LDPNLVVYKQAKSKSQPLLVDLPKLVKIELKTKFISTHHLVEEAQKEREEELLYLLWQTTKWNRPHHPRLRQQQRPLLAKATLLGLILITKF
jgi:hypothetical protein